MSSSRVSTSEYRERFIPPSSMSSAHYTRHALTPKIFGEDAEVSPYPAASFHTSCYPHSIGPAPPTLWSVSVITPSTPSECFLRENILFGKEKEQKQNLFGTKYVPLITEENTKEMKDNDESEKNIPSLHSSSPMSYPVESLHSSSKDFSNTIKHPHRDYSMKFNHPASSVLNTPSRVSISENPLIKKNFHSEEKLSIARPSKKHFV